jgi:aminoglycoside phosphotransferase (APT) family kinase protein
MADAVTALGRWHKRHEGAEWKLGQLNRYDRRHLELWARKAERLSRGSLRGAFDSSTIERTIQRLADARRTLIHGELFPANVLLGGGTLWFIDWESAGVGAGELDLAALTSGSWHESVVTELEDLYASSRWPQGAPGLFRATMAAARVYIFVTIAWHACKRTQRGDGSLAEQARVASEGLVRSR